MKASKKLLLFYMLLFYCCDILDAKKYWGSPRILIEGDLCITLLKSRAL